MTQRISNLFSWFWIPCFLFLLWHLFPKTWMAYDDICAIIVDRPKWNMIAPIDVM